MCFIFSRFYLRHFLPWKYYIINECKIHTVKLNMNCYISDIHKIQMTKKDKVIVHCGVSILKNQSHVVECKLENKEALIFLLFGT